MKAITFIFSCLLSLLMVSCNEETTSTKTLKVAATSVPHAEILEQVKPVLSEQGIDLQIIVVEDFNVPNRALVDKDVDANFFQHPAFLALQTKDFGYPLEVLGAVHIEPMGIYSHKIKSLNDLKDNAKAAVPSDPSNQARALELFEKSGLIKLSRHDAHTSILDIKDNPHHLKFVEIDSPLLARSMDDVDVAAITTNFALQSGLTPKKDALTMEDSHSDFANIVVVRKGDSQRSDLQALIKALQSEPVKKFIEEKYQGAVLPAS